MLMQVKKQEEANTLVTLLFNHCACHRRV